ncbi:MAG: hypothetical protein PHC51_04720 [bacterium]|nr:hypothetical protein [bacterium]
MTELNSLRRKAETEPGAESYLALARELVDSDRTRSEGRTLLMRTIAMDPENLIARVYLARANYLDGFSEFVVRDLLEIQRRRRLDSVSRILEVYGAFVDEFTSSGVPSGLSSAVEGVRELASFEMDTDFADILLEVEDGEKD